ncbi:MAG: hypothetical protein ABSE92_16090 [Terriglobales bacterium]
MRKFSVFKFILSFIPIIFLLILSCALSFGEDQPADVSGKWQVAWTGRLGTENAILDVHQNGPVLSGTLHDLHGDSVLSGTVEKNAVSFDVEFKGTRPYTISFSGTVDEGAMKGSSKAKGVAAYMGHGGEVVQPDRPWTATRVSENKTKKLSAQQSSQ